MLWTARTKKEERRTKLRQSGRSCFRSSFFVLRYFSLDKYVEKPCAEFAGVTTLHRRFERGHKGLVGRELHLDHVAGAKLRRRHRKLQHRRVLGTERNGGDRLIGDLRRHARRGVRAR